MQEDIICTLFVILYRGFFEETEALMSFHISQSVHCVLIGLFRLPDFGAKINPVACNPQPADTRCKIQIIYCRVSWQEFSSVLQINDSTTLWQLTQLLHVEACKIFKTLFCSVQKYTWKYDAVVLDIMVSVIRQLQQDVLYLSWKEVALSVSMIIKTMQTQVLTVPFSH